MSDFLQTSAYFSVLLTIAAFAVGNFLRRKTGKDFANPLLIALILVVIVLFVLDIDYAAYQESAKFITWLLTPATVCLAHPLYRQIQILRKNPAAVAVGALVGVLSNGFYILLLAILFKLDAQQMATLLPKSVTTAIGIGISQELGGIPALTVAAITLTGLTGSLLARTICRVCKITDPVARGLAIGASCHAIGTAKALEIGEIDGAMSSVAVAVCGLLTVVVAPFLVRLIA